MNNSFKLALIFIILSIGAYFLYQTSQKNEKATVMQDRDFTVESMDDIGTVVIKHAKLPAMVFMKTGKNNWTLNGKYPVDNAVFINVEKCLLNMKMLYIPSKAANKTIQKSIDEGGIKVTLFETGENEPLKSFYVGTDTQDGDGTHMKMEGATQPYVMHLPGLMGGLRSRFEQPVKNFRDNYLYKEPFDQIDYIKVEYPKDASSSFIITSEGKIATIKPISPSRAVPLTPLNERKLRQYIAQYESLGAEGIVEDNVGRDSIIKKIPYCIVELKSKNGLIKRNTFFGYEDIVEGKINSRTPADIKALNRLFAWSNNETFYTVQTGVFGGIFLGFEDFYK